MEEIKVVIVDDHQIVRDGIEALLLSNKQIKITGSVSGYESLMLVISNQKPDVIVLDIALPGKSGIEIAKELKEKHKEIKILMLSANSDENNITESVRAGADGFLPKDTPKEELTEAIRLVHNGEKYFGANLSKVIYNSYVHFIKTGKKKDTSPLLSERETEIIELLAEGCSCKEISEKIFISPRTVESHKANILSKLNLKNTAELIVYAIKNGIINI
jgi:DNA-binding NarL/FixJ family response regulator